MGEIIKKKYNADFYIIDQYPSKIRPFYTMPSAIDGTYSNSYDLFLRGQEICSGAQRCHDAVRSAAEKLFFFICLFDMFLFLRQC